MKRVLLFASLFFIGLGFISCNKELTESTDKTAQDDQLKPFVFTANLEDDSANPSKATIDGKLAKWSAGDKLILIPFDKEGSSVSAGYVAQTLAYRVTDPLASGGSTSASFVYTPTDAEDLEKLEKADFFAAVFNPADNTGESIMSVYSDKTTISSVANDGEVIGIAFPGVSGTVSYQDNDNVQLRVAHANTPDAQLNFKNAYHLIRFQSNCPGATKAVLTSNTNNQTISSNRLWVRFDTANSDVYSVAGTTTSTYKITKLVRPIVDGWNYFALVPGFTLTNGFKIELQTEGGVTLRTFTHTPSGSPSEFYTYRNHITTVADFDSKVSYDDAILLPSSGSNGFRIQIRQVAGMSGITEGTDNSTIKKIVIDTENYSVSTGTNLSSTSMPIFANWNSTDGIVTLSTPAPKIYVNANAERLFASLSGLETIENFDKLDFSLITGSANSLFSSSGLVSIGDISIPNATSASQMFYRCTKLESVGDISLTNATDVSAMFSDGGNPDVFKLAKLTSVGEISIPSVTNASAMFRYCTGLTSITFSDMGSDLANGYQMFYYCSKLTSINGLQSQHISDLAEMFYGCSSMVNLDLSDLAGTLTNPTAYPYRIFDNMLRFCSSLKTITFSDNLDVSALESFIGSTGTYLFPNTNSVLETINLGGLANASSLTNAKQLFYGQSKLTNIVGHLVTGSLVTAESMFDSCTSLTSVDLSGLHGNLTSIRYMFYGCANLTAIDLPEAFNTAAVSDYFYVFNNCLRLQTLRIPGFYIKSGATYSRTIRDIGYYSASATADCKVYYSPLSTDPGDTYNTTDYQDLPTAFNTDKNSARVEYIQITP